MKKKVHKILVCILTTILVVAMDINPLSIIISAVVDTGIFNAPSNMVRAFADDGDADADDPEDTGEDDTPAPIVVHSCDHSGVISAINTNGATIAGWLEDIDTDTESIDETTKLIYNALGYSDTKTLYGQIKTLYKRLKKEFKWTREQIALQQHNYRVGHLMSLNNMFQNSLYRPTLEELPDIADYATIWGQLAGLYTGTWNTKITDINSRSLWRAVDSSSTNGFVYDYDRYAEVLGDDIIVLNEGVVPQENCTFNQSTGELVGRTRTNSFVNLEDPKFVKFLEDGKFKTDKSRKADEYMDYDGYVDYETDGEYEDRDLEIDTTDEDSISIIEGSTGTPVCYVTLEQDLVGENMLTWNEAITILYRALGQEELSYQAYMQHTNDITPVNSPAYNGLSNPIPNPAYLPFIVYNGHYVYFFVTRANPIMPERDKDNNVNVQSIYWSKAIKDGFVPASSNQEEYYNKPITVTEFWVLAQAMMIAYGEPTISDQETDLVLQVYGSDFPDSYDAKITKAWKYLKVRGILEAPVDYTGYISRDYILDVATRIKDKSYRTDFKNIQFTYELNDDFINQGYYPYKGLKILNSETTLTKSMNYAEQDYYTYLIPITDEYNLGTVGNLGLYSKRSTKNKYKIEAPYFVQEIVVDGQRFYRVDISKSYSGNIYIMKSLHKDETLQKNGTITAFKFVQKSNSVKGGIFTRFEYNSSKNFVTMVNYLPDDVISFTAYDGYNELIDCVDGVRTGESKGDEYSYNKYSLMANLSMVMTSLCSPIKVHAQEFVQDEDIRSKKTITINFDKNSEFDKLNTTIKNVDTLGGKGDKQIYTNLKYNDELNHQLRGITNEKELQILSYINVDNPVVQAFGVWAFLTGGSYLNGGYAKVSSFRQTVQKGLNRSQQNNTFYDLFTYNVPDISSGALATQFGTSDPQLVAALCYGLHGYGSNIAPNRHYSSVGSLNIDYKVLVDSSTRSNFSNTFNNPKLYDAVKKLNGKVYNVEEVTTSTGMTAIKVMLQNSSDEQVVSDIIASAEADDNKGYSNDGNSNDSAEETKQEKIDTQTTAVTDAILNSETEQIFIKKSDLQKYGFIKGEPVIGTAGTNKTTLTLAHNDSKIVIDPMNNFVIIGQVLYDFSKIVAQNKNFKYYFVDSNNELYFDIRCIYGLINDSKVDATEVTESDSAFGSGKYKILNLKHKATDNGLYVKDGKTVLYTYPEVPNQTYSQGLYSKKDYGEPFYIISSTKWDGQTTQNGITYNPECKRVALSEYNPTSNYILVKGEDYAWLFIWGIRNNNLQSSKTFKKCDYGGLTEAQLASLIIEEDRKRTGSSIKDQLETTLGLSITDNTITKTDGGKLKAIDKATIYGAVMLYSFTGLTYLSSNYTIRAINLTDSSIDNPYHRDNYTSKGALKSAKDRDKNLVNKPGAIYFIPEVGFVYNMPYENDFAYESYLSGRYPIPLTYNSDVGVINYNVSYYGAAAEKEGDNWVDNKRILKNGEVLTSKGIVNLLEKGSVISEVPLKSNPNDPFPVDVDQVITAPIAIYRILSPDIYKVGTLKDVSGQLTKWGKLYWGNHQLQVTNSDLTSVNCIILNEQYQTFKLPRDTKVIQMIDRNGNDVYIIEPKDLTISTASLSSEIEVIDLPTSDQNNALEAMSSNSLIQAIDEGSSFLILFAFKVFPIIGIILITILVGLAFMVDIKVVRVICEKTIDPIKILTLGGRDMNSFSWKNILLPCIILYAAFALLLNGNLIRIIEWVSEWYGSIVAWFRTL